MRATRADNGLAMRRENPFRPLFRLLTLTPAISAEIVPQGCHF